MKRTFNTEKKLYTLSLLVQDIPGVLSQVARLFSGRAITSSPLSLERQPARIDPHYHRHPGR